MIQNLLNGFHNLEIKDIASILAILVMDAALSADNSLAISAMAQGVKQSLQSPVIYCGLVVAAILRILTLAFATFIIANPWVQILGAFYLCYLFWGHFSKHEDDDAADKSDPASGTSTFIKILFGIGLLDLSLSTDNIIAVVSMSQNFAVITLGVLASILMLAVASQVVRMAMEKLPSIEDAAYVILLFLAILMFANHTAETVVWIGKLMHMAPIINGEKSILQYRWDAGEGIEIAGVLCILLCAVLKDFIQIKKNRNVQPLPQNDQSF